MYSSQNTYGDRVWFSRLYQLPVLADPINCLNRNM